VVRFVEEEMEEEQAEVLADYDVHDGVEQVQQGVQPCGPPNQEEDDDRYGHCKLREQGQRAEQVEA